MTGRWIWGLSVMALLASPAAAAAETRFALIVSGASGGEKYAEQMMQWRATLQSTLVERYGFEAANVRVLTDESVAGGTTGSAAPRCQRGRTARRRGSPSGWRGGRG